MSATGPQPADRGAPALVLLEEAVHLLRFAPARVRSLYLVGTIPFLLGFLYFWADMTRNVNAESHLAPAALGVTLLFLWMKYWQSAAVSELHAHCTGAKVAPWTKMRVLRLIYIQTVLQPFKFLALPLAAFLALPFAAVCAWFHAVALYGDGTRPVAEVRQLARAAATPWPGQNFMGLLWISLGGLFIFFNLYVLGMLLPQMLKIFTGVESSASRSMEAYVFNSTFFAAALATAHLFLFALTSAFYTMRCFRAQSRFDGRDLLHALDLARAGRALRKAVALVLLAALLLPAPLLAVVSAPPPPPSAGAREAQLDRALTEVFERREFAWRLPRAGRETKVREENALDRFFGQIGRWIQSVYRKITDWWNAIREWFRRKAPDGDGNLGRGGALGWSGALAAQPLLYVLLGLVVVVAAWVAWKQWRTRTRRTVASAVAAVPAAAPVANLEDESVLASQMPEDDWLRLAGELEGRGEFRLALRALFLAGLAGLAGRGALLIARHKSNRDYQREIERRGRNRAEWAPAFAQGVRVFERCWYGEHPADREVLAEFRGLLGILQREPAAPRPQAPPLPTAPPLPA